MSTGDWRIRRGLRARAITKSRVPRAAPGMVCFQNLPARQCPPVRQAFRCLLASCPSCPSGIRSAAQPCHVRHPGPRSATPFGAAPFALWRPYPPGGLGKFRRTNMTAMPGKVACLYAICLSGASPPLLCVSTPESHTFSFLPCHDMAVRDGRHPFLSAGFPIFAQAQRQQARRQKFLEGWGTGRGNLFPKRFPSPQRFPPNFRLLQIFRHPPAALPRNVPLGKRSGDEHSSQPATRYCPPAGERQA